MTHDSRGPRRSPARASGGDGLWQTAGNEETVLRERRAERRRLTQEAAVLDAEADREFAEAAVGIARETFGDPR